MKCLVPVLLSMVLSLGAFAQGEDNVLLWFFENPDIAEVDGSGMVKANDLVGRGGDAAGKTVNMLRIRATDSNGVTTYLGLGSLDGGFLDGWEIPDNHGAMKAGPSYADISGLTLSDTGLKFAMELGYAEFDDQDAISSWILMASSEVQTVAQLVAGGHIIASELSYQGGFDWDGGAFAVPEPMSGLLWLFGVSALALRRRRVR